MPKSKCTSWCQLISNHSAKSCWLWSTPSPCCREACPGAAWGCQSSKIPQGLCPEPVLRGGHRQSWVPSDSSDCGCVVKGQGLTCLGQGSHKCHEAWTSSASFCVSAARVKFCPLPEGDRSQALQAPRHCQSHSGRENPGGLGGPAPTPTPQP